MNVSYSSGDAAARVASTRGLTVLLVAIAILWVPFALYYVIPANSLKTSQGTTRTKSVFQLTLVEIMDTPWNSTIAQPQFFVMSAKGLTPAGNISLPANTPIQLTIVSYDSATPGSTAKMGLVNGTEKGTVYMINGSTAMGTDPNQRWGKNVTAVPGSQLAHTFTLPQLGINIPVVGGDTQIAYLYLTKTGTFQWFCLTPCGFGADGMGGAMSKPGWMSGQVTVY